MEWFESIYKTYYQDIYKFVFAISSGNHVVEDIVQDVFMVLYRKQNKLITHPYIKGWLYTTARNIAWDYMKKKNRKIKYELQLSTQALTETYHLDIVPNNIYDLLSDFLSDNEIELLKLNNEYGFTVKEISQSRGMRYSAISKKLWRIKQKIKTMLITSIILNIVFVIKGVLK